MPQLSPLTSHFSPPPAALPYNPALSLWLSVDPLSDKYPGVSPYVYCANNPVRLVDPDGRDFEIVVNSEGEEPSITIRASFSISENDRDIYTQACNEAIQAWNAQSGKYAIKCGNKEYTIKFDLSISDGSGNCGHGNSIVFVDQLNTTTANALGVTLPKDDEIGGLNRIEILRNLTVGSYKQIIMHEIGHSLGLSHTNGVMSENAYWEDESIYQHHVGGILNNSSQFNIPASMRSSLRNETKCYKPQVGVSYSNSDFIISGNIIWKR